MWCEYKDGVKMWEKVWGKASKNPHKKPSRSHTRSHRDATQEATQEAIEKLSGKVRLTMLFKSAMNSIIYCDLPYSHIVMSGILN